MFLNSETLQFSGNITFPINTGGQYLSEQWFSRSRSKKATLLKELNEGEGGKSVLGERGAIPKSFPPLGTSEGKKGTSSVFLEYF